VKSEKDQGEWRKNKWKMMIISLAEFLPNEINSLE